MSNHYISQRDYLESTGVLEHGSDEDIAQSKKAYRKKYMRAYQKRRRREKKFTTVMLKKDEYQRLYQEATAQKVSLAAFLRLAAFAYLDQLRLIPRTDTLIHIEQLLSLMYSEIKYLSQHYAPDSYHPLYYDLLEKITHLERMVAALLGHTKENDSLECTTT